MLFFVWVYQEHDKQQTCPDGNGYIHPKIVDAHRRGFHPCAENAQMYTVVDQYTGEKE